MDSEAAELPMKAFMEEQIRQLPDEISPPHGISSADVRSLLIDPPRRVLVRDMSGVEFPAWVVLGDAPAGEPIRYFVLFDEVSARFGLSIEGLDGKVFDLVGMYGTLLTTLRCM